MAGPYLIGVDCGTQSAKVVIYDADGNAVSEGRRALRAMSRPRHGVAFHPDDDLWDSIAAASRQAMAGFDGDPVARVEVTLDWIEGSIGSDGVESATEPSLVETQTGRSRIAPQPAGRV